MSGEIEFWNAFCFVGRPDTTEKRAKRQVSRIILAEGIFNQQTDSSSSISSEALRRLLCVEGIESSTGKSFVPRLHFPSRSAADLSLIIGGGPGGLSAALTFSRLRRSCLV